MWKRYTRVPILAAAMAASALAFLMPSTTIAATSAPAIDANYEPGGLDAVFGTHPALTLAQANYDLGADGAGAGAGPASAPVLLLALETTVKPVRDDINKTDHAMGHALGALVLDPGDIGFGIGMSFGTFEGKQAVAAGVSYSPGSMFTIKGTTAASADGEVGAGVSIGLSF